MLIFLHPGDRVESFSDKANSYNLQLEQELSQIKPAFDRLVEGSKVLLEVLDEVSKIHPFVSGAPCIPMT